jgi:hypothetical protein
MWFTALLVVLPSSGQADYRLVVKPQLCITTVQRPACAVEVELRWQAPALGDHCVFSDQGEAPRACWQASAAGSMTENQVLEQSRSYWLTATDAKAQQRLAQAEIKVLAAKSTDKRRNRRRRHVWSLL